MTNAIHIHEDDWEMRSLYPLAAQQEVAGDLDKAIQSSIENRAPNGVGWTKMHIISAPSEDYSAFKIEPSVLGDALSKVMPRVTRFSATIMTYIGSEDRDPYGAYEEQAWCFGVGPDCFVKLEVQERFVSRIWFNFECKPENENLMRAAFQAVENISPSCLVDYFLDVQGSLSDSGFVDQYFELHREQAAYVEHAMEEHRRLTTAAEQDGGSKTLLSRMLGWLRQTF